MATSPPARPALALDDPVGRGEPVDPVERLASRVPVELVHWPRQSDRRDALARAGVPRLLLVPAGERPPVPMAMGEDWIRVPADERDVSVRLQRLHRQSMQSWAERPVLDRDAGRLNRAGRHVILSPSEVDVLAELLDQPGRVVAREHLEVVVWPDGPPSHRALDSVVYRLRHRVAEIGLVVLTARGRGFLVDADSVGSVGSVGSGSPS